MSPSGLHFNKPVIFVLLLGFILALIYWMRSSSAPAQLELSNKKSWKTGDWKELPQSAKDSMDKVQINYVKDKKVKVGEMENLKKNLKARKMWKSKDWQTIPQKAKEDIAKAKINHVKDKQVDVDGTKVTVAYREAKPDSSKVDVLFLHGQSFKSQTWVEDPVYTLQILYNLGFHAVAIDLPGYGDSPTLKVSVDRARYLESVISELQLQAPVIVSPSMSGGYSLPYLFKDPDSVLSRCRGFVPVAPVGTGSYTSAQYAKLKVPTLIVYGENDKSIGPKSVSDLKKLPESVLDEIKGAGHACYMNKPDDFNSHLYTFLLAFQN